MGLLQEFEQLRLKSPRLYNINVGSENSDYCTHSDKNKSCYLLFGGNFNQDCMYGGVILNSRDCADNNYCEYGELCYECVDVNHCYGCYYSQDLKNCSDCAFCYDCVGCQNCFGAVSQRQKQYVFFNEQLPREEYESRMKNFNYKNAEEVKDALERADGIQQTIPRKAFHISKSENCTGEHISSSKNCFFCFDAHECQDCSYLQDCWRTKDCTDMTFSDGSELCYDSFSIGLNTYNCNFCNYVRTCSDCEYSELLFNCKHCFGCVYLQNKEFYILNVQYSKDEYFRRIAEIKVQMMAEGEYGRQLPTTYKYEDTAAVWWK
ncbi:MAG: hypothetical protein AAB606_02875 [Patescibacteria group bacterium]